VLILKVCGPEGETWEQQIVDETVIIGRSKNADITINDRSLSRSHARVYLSGDSWFVEDLDSRNGSFLDGNPIRDITRFELGMTLNLGSSYITIAEQVQAAAEQDGIDLASGNTLFRSVDELIESGIMAPPDGVPLIPGRDVENAAVEHLRILNEVHQALGRSVELSELLDLILQKVFDHLKPEEAAIFLKEGDGFRRAAARSTGGKPDSLASKSLFREVVEGRQAALVLDARMDERFNQAQSLMISGLRSILAAPLLDGDRALGMIVLGSRHGLRSFEESDMELLVSLASVAAMRIANVRLAEEAAERRRMEQELALGRRIQVALIPETLPEIDGWQLFAENLPCRGVSGDIYNFIQREDGKLIVMIADVSGKGIAAALLTASLEALSAGPIDVGMPLDDVCRRVGRLLYQRTPPEKYATAFFAEIDVKTGRLSYVNAGHNPGLLLKLSGESRWLEATGIPLGLLPEGEYTIEEVDLAPRDVLMLYTDGLTEAANPEGEEFGEARLRSFALMHRLKGLDEFSSLIARGMDEFVESVPYGDDRTLVVIRRLSELSE